MDVSDIVRPDLRLHNERLPVRNDLKHRRACCDNASDGMDRKVYHVARYGGLDLQCDNLLLHPPKLQQDLCLFTLFLLKVSLSSLKKLGLFLTFFELVMPVRLKSIVLPCSQIVYFTLQF